MELHCVHHWDAANRRAYVEGFVVDRLDSEANASGCRVPMLRNIVVRDLTFVHRAPVLKDYSTALHFTACQNVLLDHVTFDRVRVAREGYTRARAVIRTESERRRYSSERVTNAGRIQPLFRVDRCRPVDSA